MRMTAPSRPSRPTTAEAATTLCTQIMLPAAPPTACSATIQVGSTAIRWPMSNWNSENIMLLTVLLPAHRGADAADERREEGPRRSHQRRHAVSQGNRHAVETGRAAARC